MESQLAVIQLTPERLSELLQQASSLAVMQALKNAGVPIRELFTRAEFSRMHGRGQVSRLIKQGHLKPHKIEGGKKMYAESDYQLLIK